MHEERSDTREAQVQSSLASLGMDPNPVPNPVRDPQPAAPASSIRAKQRKKSSSSGKLWHKDRLSSVWEQLRGKRREVSAIVVILLMAAFWFDIGGASSKRPAASPNPLEGFDEFLSEFEPHDSTRPLRDSAEPVDNSSQSTLTSNSLFIPPSTDSNVSAFSEEKPPVSSQAEAQYFNESPSIMPRNTAKPQSAEPRRIKFAGRIQPAN